MGKDYYKILGVPRNASQEDIKKAYRKLALKWHPDRVPKEKQAEAQSKFQEIGEAFDVLSDEQKKSVYDQYGEEALKGGMPADAGDEQGGGAGPQFHFQGMPGGARSFRFTQNNAEDIFRAFFGTSDPFQAAGGGDDPFGGDGGGFGGGFPFMMGGMGGMPRAASMGGGMGGMPQFRQQQEQRKADPVHYPLKVSLEDLFTGRVKKVRISKKIADQSGRTVNVSVDKEINIKPGWKDGTKITFEREGDELPGIIPADIVFTVTTKPHDRFERNGDDLLYTHTISLHEALTGVRFHVESLDGRQIAVDARHVTPDTIKIIPGEGMPNSKTKSRGDLRLKFHILFPDLTESERQQIASILRSSAASSSSSSSRYAHK